MMIVANDVDTGYHVSHDVLPLFHEDLDLRFGLHKSPVPRNFHRNLDIAAGGNFLI